LLFDLRAAIKVFNPERHRGTCSMTSLLDLSDSEQPAPFRVRNWAVGRKQVFIIPRSSLRAEAESGGVYRFLRSVAERKFIRQDKNHTAKITTLCLPSTSPIIAEPRQFSLFPVMHGSRERLGSKTLVASTKCNAYLITLFLCNVI